MEPKRFQSLEEVERWLEENPDEVGRHILESWRYLLENDLSRQPIVQCDEVSVTAEKHQAEGGIQALMESAVGREDYELAQRIKDLQEEFSFSE